MKTMVGMAAEQAARVLLIETVPVVVTGTALPRSTASAVGAHPVQCRVELVFQGGRCTAVVTPQRRMTAVLFPEAADPPPISLRDTIVLLRGEEDISVTDCHSWCRLGWRRPAEYDEESLSNSVWDDAEEGDIDAEWGVVWCQPMNHKDRDYTQATACPCCENGYWCNSCHEQICVGGYNDWQLPTLEDLILANEEENNKV